MNLKTLEVYNREISHSPNLIEEETEPHAKGPFCDSTRAAETGQS